MGKMMNSGVEWIAEIPEKWNISKIKFIGNISSGEILSKEEYIDDGDYAVIGANGEIGRYYKYNITKTVIATGRVGTIGTVRMYNHVWLSDNVLSLDVKKENIKYIRYLLECANLERLSTTTAQPLITATKLGNIFIVLPILDEQKLIANFLDDKVGKIDKILFELNRQIEILNKYKKSLVTETITKGLNPNVQMKESGIDYIGKIPKDWDIKKVKYILKPNCVNLRVGPFGSALAGDDFKDEGYWVYNQRCVLDENFYDNDTFVNVDKFCELKGFKVLPNDILLTTRGTIGKVAIVPENAPEGILHPCIIKFVVDERYIYNKLIKYIFNYSSLIEEQIYRKSNSTTIEVIYSNTLKELLLPIIPLSEQENIVKFLDKKCFQIDELIKDKQTQIEKMEKYKKSLIYEYVTGKKRVKGAEELYG